jgi:hypothetical protein
MPNTDWIGTTDDMLDRLRPGLRLPGAIVIASIVLGLCAVWSAEKLGEEDTPFYEFKLAGDSVLVLDPLSGSITSCRYKMVEDVICTRPDSGSMAVVRETSEKLWE